MSLTLVLQVGLGGLAQGCVDADGWCPAEEVAGFADVDLQVAAEALGDGAFAH